jgi:hypothetical protein
MSGSRSRAELLKFLDYVGSKGLLSPATAESRKASVNKVLGILSDDEAEDVSKLDLEEVVHRFANLHGQSYTQDSLRTYKSRTKSSIEDFLRYVDNPLSFKVGGQTRERKSKQSNGQAGAPRREMDAPPPAPPRGSPPIAASSILPIPIRADLVVHVQGLPFDLTEAEAKKIANVIQAMASPA